MRKSVGMLVAVILLALYATPARADTMAGAAIGEDPFTLYFDEDGNGRYVQCNPTCGPSVNDPGVLMPDPVNGGALGLAYRLPEAVGLGDGLVLDAAGVGSDVLRFSFIGGAYWMFYYSFDVGNGHLADRPTRHNASPFDAREDAAGDFCWLCSFGPPPIQNNYRGNSPDVAEPAMLLLLGGGLAGLSRRFRSKRAN